MGHEMEPISDFKFSEKTIQQLEVKNKVYCRILTDWQQFRVVLYPYLYYVKKCLSLQRPAHKYFAIVFS